MKRAIPLIVVVGFVGLLWLLIEPPPGPAGDPTVWQSPPESFTQPDDGPPPAELTEPRTGGADWQRRFFADWHRPYGPMLPPEIEDQIQSELARIPSEGSGPGGEKAINSWICVGPSGMQTGAGALYSGRVLDIDALGGPSTTIAAASGGLWRYELLFPVPLTEDVTSQWIGSMAYDPDDPDTILLGTGEFWVRNGTGLWKSEDGGTTWRNIPMNPTPGAFFRIRWGSDGHTVHAATRSGYYRSTDDGETWTQVQFTGAVSDIAVVPPPVGTSGDDVLYLTRWGEGLYLSVDEGLFWGKATNAVIPTSDVTRGAVTVCLGSPGVIYVAFTHEETEIVGGETKTYHRMKGIYKTTNYGYNWSDVSPASNYFGNQGWYNNVIAVSPTNPNLVYAGGVSLLRSTNGGASWETVSDSNLHVDYHALQWSADGQYLWAGHDGGWSFSNDHGYDGTWTSGTNYLPITQYTEFDARGVSWVSASLVGGSQDNGISATYDGGSSWDFVQGGDGGGIQFGFFHNLEVWFALGYSSGDISFPRYYSSDGGVTKSPINLGLDDHGTWYPAMRADGDLRMYTHGDGFVYSRTNTDLAWMKEMSYGFSSNVSELTVSQVPGNKVLWACLATDTEYQCYVKQGDWWYNRKSGLPVGTRVRKVVPHPTDPDAAYALMNGLGSPGQKIFYTPNYGRDWTNITGNLPNVPLADLIVHPGNDDWLYLGTEYGHFRSLDGGASWHRWNNGCPKAVVVTELKAVDMTPMRQGYHIVSATYGRSIWRRDITGSDPVGVPGAPPPALLAVDDAAPNPFNPSTTIRFRIAEPKRVGVTVYDAAGRAMRRLLNENLEAGPHEVTWNGRDDQGRSLASGAYLVQVQAGSQREVRKVLLAK